MEILKGKVQDPGFPDTEVTYLKTDDGKTYFFIENGTLKNGNIISTPILKEGIGHAPYTSLGLIDKDGNVLIPFENKNIKALSDDLLLVEKAKPTTQSVVDAASKQTDPLSASELIQTSDTIKSQMKSVMGSNSSYVFDNQFSEAALFTASGVNLANNYFSFIGLSNGAYYMSQNVVGSPISKYDPYANAASQAQEESNQVGSQESSNQPDEQPIEDTSIQNENNIATDPLLPNISGLENQEETSNNVETQENGQSQQEVQLPDTNSTIANVEIPAIAGMEIPVSNENGNTSSENQGDNTISKEETVPIENSENANSNNVLNDNNVTGGLLPNIESSNDQTSSENGEKQDSFNETKENEKLKLNIDDTQEEIQDNNSDDGEDKVATKEDNQNIEATFTDDNGDGSTDYSDFSKEDQINNDNLGNYESPDDGNEHEENNNSVNYWEGSDSQNIDEEDSSSSVNDSEQDSNGLESQEESDLNPKGQEDEYNNYEEDIEEEINNPVIINATNTIKKLLEENRKQRQIIDRQEGEIETLNSTNEILKEDNSEKTKEIISLRKTMSKYRSDNTELSRENNHLKSTNSRQEEIIDYLKTQNTTLKEQVAGITALGNAVAEANTLFTPEKETDSGSNDNNIEFGYLGEDDGYQYTKKAA